MSKKKVLFFGDFGVDDIVATTYSYYNEEIEIVGFVADYGNVFNKMPFEISIIFKVDLV
ncbi:hypothetical protein [Rossellomorea sp. BNER]|jgi:purine nucleosidase|uniref:hypothetical protein n=1 Tax=Rossellomorea sp. BNER TaxID=2962031 RepID=UPI003AF2FA51|nr:hypothetical protein [Rossellomorea sp. BNER]